MPEDPRLVELEILKALHEASFHRWEKRRNYEWLLSYTIWGALAAFIALVAFGKDSRFTAPNPWALAVTLFLVAVVHAFYLYFMTDGTIRDLKTQENLEETMRELSTHEEIESRGNDSAPPMPPAMLTWWRETATPFLKPRHGFLAQTVITILLCITAGWAGIAAKQTPTPSAPPAFPTSVCEGCAQYFTPPPQAGSSTNVRPTTGQNSGAARKNGGKSGKTVRHRP